MGDKPNVLLIITQDTKAEEAKFVRAELESAGVGVVHLDPSIRRTIGGAELPPEEIAGAAGMTIEQVRDLRHEGKCIAVMIDGSTKLAVKAVQEGRVQAALAIGGSMGTGLAGLVFQALPYGFPKLIVSTMASGMTAPYVGRKDIAMMNAVTDIAGLNSLSRDIYRNAAHAAAGMAKAYSPSVRADKPLVLITTLGTTEKATRRIRESLEADGAEVLVFHSSGNGGPTLDSIAAERNVALVLDLSLTEILDTLLGGLCAGGPDRSKAALARGIPTIFAPGNSDFIVGGTLEASQAAYPGRRYHVHNPALTAVRTTLDDLQKLAEHLAGLAQKAEGPVEFFVPLNGFSHHDSPEGYIHEPGIPAQFADIMRRLAPMNAPVTTVDAHFNDAEFADAITASARAYLAKRAAA